MAWENHMGISGLPLTASGDMSANQYKFVMQATDDKKFLLATGGCAPGPLGVLQNDPVSGETGNVQILGATQLWFSGSVAASMGSFLTSGSAGGAEVAALSTFSAVALQDIAAGSGYISALLVPYGRNLIANEG